MQPGAGQPLDYSFMDLKEVTGACLHVLGCN